MAKKFLALLAALFLIGCEQDSRVAADGYTFKEAEYEKTNLSVSIVQYDSRRDFIQGAKSVGANVEGLQAFAMISPNTNECEIHIERIKVNYRPEWLGHELTHCIHGRWHP